MFTSEIFRQRTKHRVYFIPLCVPTYLHKLTRDFFELYIKNQLKRAFDNGNHLRAMIVYRLKVNNRLKKKAKMFKHSFSSIYTQFFCIEMSFAYGM